MVSINAQALAIIGEPDGRVVVLSAREEEIVVPVVHEKRQWSLMAFHQNRPHTSYSTLSLSLSLSLSLNQHSVSLLRLPFSCFSLWMERLED